MRQVALMVAAVAAYAIFAAVVISKQKPKR